MRLIFFLFIASLVSDARSQSVKRVTVRDIEHESEEIFYVLTTDNKVRHGTYQLMKYHKLKTEGNYDMNLKEGTWKEYDFSGKKVIRSSTYHRDTLNGPFVEYFTGGTERTSGNYANGKMDGIWLFHDWTGKIFESGQYSDGVPTGIWNIYNGGKIVQQYDFSRPHFLFNSDTTDYSNFIVYDNNQRPIDTLDLGCRYIGGNEHLKAFIGSELEYPASAREKEIEGTVTAVLEIGVKGEIISVQILHGIGGGCDEESVRVLKLTSGKWLPAEDHGKPVETRIIVPVNFLLQ